jgi:DNA polymerase-1
MNLFDADDTQKSSMPTLYLIDGNSYIYRAYYAVKGLANAKGFPTNAIFGFTTMLLKMVKEKQPDYFAVVLDPPGPTVRNAMFADYKSNRPKMPEDLAIQLPYIKNIIELLNIPVFQIDGYEADDALATIATKAEQQGLRVFIVTGDKDLKQIISPQISVYDGMKDKVIGVEEIEAQFGVAPGQLPEIMALMGDASDNIPGAQGIGKAHAISLIKKHKTLEAILAGKQKITPPRIAQIIADNIDNIKLSFSLVVLDRNVPLDFCLEDLAVKEPNWPPLAELFHELEFHSLLKTMPSQKPSAAFTLLDSPEAIRQFLANPMDAVGLEIVFSQDKQEQILGIALALTSEEYAFIPILNDSSSALDALKPLLENSSIDKVIHYVKEKQRALKRLGIELQGKTFDTMIADYLLVPNRQEHSYETALTHHLGVKKSTLKELLSKNKKSLTQEETAAHACDNVASIFTLKQRLETSLTEKDLKTLYDDVEMPLVAVLTRMEDWGVKISAPQLKAISEELEKELASIEQRINLLAGTKFNINSPKQLQEVLFTKLGLKPSKKTKTGYSTDVEVLQELALSHELPFEILEHRTLFKLKNTYVDPLPEFINPITGRIHPTFNQTATATGRLSASNPNLQNIPIRGKWAKRIRQAFIAEDGCVLLSADYTQIELRIFAHLSQDKNLLHAFNAGEDIHTATAAELFDVRLDRVTEDMRRKAKTVNFGIIYGISAFGLHKQLGITQKEAKRYIEKFFYIRQGVQAYIEQVQAQALELGYVKTLLGRRREIPEIRSSNKTVQQLGQRLAVNSPVQGAAADIIKIAMLKMDQDLIKHRMKTKMALQVHDELLFEIPENELDQAEPLIRQNMEHAVELSVPLTVSIGKGKSWVDAH